MVQVLRFGGFRIYIFREIGGKHHLPHCHVSWPDGVCSVGLDEFEVLAGSKLPKHVLLFLENHERELWAAWDMINGGKQ